MRRSQVRMRANTVLHLARFAGSRDVSDHDLHVSRKEHTMAKILVVDDDPDFVEVTRIVLERAGYLVIEAHSATWASSAPRATSPT
jgi:PleD family two-component response regulator